jgi:hypothetical protein
MKVYHESENGEKTYCKTSCKMCYGRGYEGTHTAKDKNGILKTVIVPCPNLARRVKVKKEKPNFKEAAE